MTGLCQCGCGERTKVSSQNNSWKNHVSGCPVRFVHGHSNRKYHIDRLFEYGFRSPSGCLLWPGSSNPNIYGSVKKNGTPLRVPRIAYELTFGAIPFGMFVLHKCDTPQCYEPSHLFLGTASDNAKDKVSKDRQTRGSSNGGAKLTEADVFEIMKMISCGTLRHREIAERFSVSTATIVSALEVMKDGPAPLTRGYYGRGNLK